MLRGEFMGKKKVRVTVQPAAGDSDKPSLKIEGAESDTMQPEAVGAHADGT
jgi:hypothetical protein